MAVKSTPRAGPREHHKVGVESGALDTAHAEEREAVVVLQASELALDGRAAAAKAPPERAAARDVDIALGLALPEGHDRRATAFAAPRVDPVVVIALVHRNRLRKGASGAYWPRG